MNARKQLIASFLLLAAAPAQAAWQAGAARVDTTPPLFDAAADAAAFPLCPASVYKGPRPFALEEPYIDVNGNGVFDFGTDQYCDANLNGHWDGIYSSGGVNHQAQTVHDPLDARAIALSDGTTTLVIESIVEQGIFINVIDRIRARAKELRPGITDVIVSANHNESSPDLVGIYGSPVLLDSFGLFSSIDYYYVDYLVEQAAQAAAQAYDAMQPATLWAHAFPTPMDLSVHLSKNFPTTNDDGSPAAIDPKLRVLQARDASGKPLFTVMNLAAHNQEIGHSKEQATQLSADWPGFFHNALERQVPGMAMFLVADNGSEEDPETVPLAVDPDCDGCYEQSQATGEAFASAVAREAPKAVQLAEGPLSYERTDFFVPLENNLFKVAVVLGLFGERETYLAGVPSSRLGTDLKTTVGLVNVGPDLQMLANPGEAFPGLMLGSPWGIEEASCPDRENPPVPAWHGHAPFRFQLGLTNDFTGYMIPAWGFTSTTGIYLTNCHNNQDDIDAAGHQHKLETEGVGPTISNLVAQNLTALLDKTPDPAALIRQGRYVLPDGSLSRRADGAVGIWTADAGATTLARGKGMIVALGSVQSFGDQPVNRQGTFMDYDGQPQDVPDLSTRGMLVRDAGGNVVQRYYLDLYPALGGESSLPPASTVATATPVTAGAPAHSRFGGALDGFLLTVLAAAGWRRRRR